MLFINMWVTYSIIASMISICLYPADLDALIQEEVKGGKMSEMVCSDDRQLKGVQHRNRTTFTQEQSSALEQGDFTSVKGPRTSQAMSHSEAQLQTCVCLLDQSSPTATMQICTPEKNWQPRSNFLRTPSR